MKFRDWYIKSHLTQETIAKQLGIGTEWVNRILCNSRKPSIKLAVRIINMTRGEVTLSDLLPELKDVQEIEKQWKHLKITV